MSKITVIGAGKTGRGFIGRLLKESNCSINFIDKNRELIDKLNSTGSFDVAFFGNQRKTLTVDNYTASTWEDASFEDTELILVSVCGQNLPDVGKMLSEKLDSNKKYYIITCENSSKPAQVLKNAIIDKNVAVSESTVFCTTIESDGYNINSENYPYLQCNADLLEGYIPQISGIRPVGNFSDFLNRKLYTYNAASCVIAYVGALMGYTDYGEAANDKTILKLMDKNYAETNKAICMHYGYDLKDQEEFAALSKIKFCDRTIIDTVSRNAREPHRKLGNTERIIGAAQLLKQYGMDSSVLELTAAAAILYEDTSDAVWSDIRKNNTPEDILKSICGLKNDDPLYTSILDIVNKLSNDKDAAINKIANS